jgi:hypothetical protein
MLLANHHQPQAIALEEPAMNQMYRTLRVDRGDLGVLRVVIDAPPMNLIGPEVVRDLVTLIGELETHDDIQVLVLESADPEYQHGAARAPRWPHDASPEDVHGPPVRC